jgi:hypothetical protein
MAKAMVDIPLTEEWRQRHLQYGDEAMDGARALLTRMTAATVQSAQALAAAALAAVAQAHYTAAGLPRPIPEETE